MALNFSDVVNKKLEDIERPPLPPVGVYRWSITKLPEATTSNDGKWDILSISCRAVEYVDVPEADSYPGEVNNITNQVKFMFNKEDEAEYERSLFNARNFFEKHVQCAGPSDSLGQAMNSSVNGQFLGSIIWNQSKKPGEEEVFFANLVRTAPLE